MKTMKTWLAIPFLTLLFGCTSGNAPKQETQPLSYEIQLHTTPYDLRPGGPGKAYWLQVVQQPANQIVDLTTWPTGTWRWELVGVPSGVDGGQFAITAFGHFSDRIIPPDFPTMKTTLTQVYYPPAALPPGTTRMELKARITITPPDSLNGGPVAHADSPIVLDVNASTLAPPKNEVLEEMSYPGGVK